MNNMNMNYVFFLRGMYFFFNFFHSFFLKILFSTNNNFKFPYGINASRKGSTKLAYTYTSDQSSIWAMPCGPLLNSEIIIIIMSHIYIAQNAMASKRFQEVEKSGKFILIEGIDYCCL